MNQHTVGWEVTASGSLQPVGCTFICTHCGTNTWDVKVNDLRSGSPDPMIAQLSLFFTSDFSSIPENFDPQNPIQLYNIDAVSKCIYIYIRILYVYIIILIDMFPHTETTTTTAATTTTTTKNLPKPPSLVFSGSLGWRLLSKKVPAAEGGGIVFQPPWEPFGIWRFRTKIMHLPIYETQILQKLLNKNATFSYHPHQLLGPVSFNSLATNVSTSGFQGTDQIHFEARTLHFLKNAYLNCIPWKRNSFFYRENGGTLGMVPLINPINTPYVVGIYWVYHHFPYELAIAILLLSCAFDVWWIFTAQLMCVM